LIPFIDSLLFFQVTTGMVIIRQFLDLRVCAFPLIMLVLSTFLLPVEAQESMSARVSPFSNAPKVFPIHQLTPGSGGLRAGVITYLPGNALTNNSLKLFRRGDKNVAELYDKNQTLSATYQGLWSPICLFGAYVADFNGDSRQDYLIAIGTTACGLPKEEVQLTFFLSKGTNYAVHALRSALWDTNYFVDLDNNGKCFFVQTGIIDFYDVGIRNAASMESFFWVHRLVGFSPSGLQNAPRQPFPVFIDYNKWATNTAHVRSTRLSNKRKVFLADQLFESLTTKLIRQRGE
jgi:hypothetical protein